MKKEYTVVLRADSALRIKDNGGKLNFEFNWGDLHAKCCFADILSEEYETKIHKFIQIEVDLCDDDINNAIQNARDIADFFFSICCFATNASVSPPEVHLAYDKSAGEEHRQFIQYFYDIGLSVKAKRDLEREYLNLLLEKIGPYAKKERIGRALRWYRKSLLEEDLLDRFNSIWFALESLDPLLREKYSLMSDYRKCENCGHEMKIPTTVGINYLFSEFIVDGNNLYGKAKEARNGLFHGFRSINSIIQDAKELIPNMEKAVKKALLLLLEIAYGEDEKWFLNPLTNIPKIYMRVGCTIDEPDIYKLTANKRHPHFKDQHIIINSREDSFGKVTFTSKVELTKEFDGEFTPGDIEIYGPEEGHIIKITSPS